MTALDRAGAPTTLGTLLDGRVRYEQPARGYRTGIEPVFLAAAVPARPGQHVLEGGTGAGAALLCLLARVPGVTGVGVERDPFTAAVARRNAPVGMTVHTTPLDAFRADASFDHACANPPWHDPGGTPSPNPRRRAALHAEHGGMLAAWCRWLCRAVHPGGTVTLVLPAGQADAGLAGLRAAGAGGARVRPLAPRQEAPARIVMVHAVLGATSPTVTLPALVLHPEVGPGYSAAAEAVLRGGAALSWDA